MFTYDHNSNSTNPNNQIWYTSSDGMIVTPYDSSAFGVSIVSNTYSEDKGVIVFSDDVHYIDYKAFYNRTSLTSIIIPDGVTSIGDWAFRSCSSLESITIPESVTNIGDYAFANCSSLISVNIPDNLTEIGEYAFLGCNNLPIYKYIRYADTYAVSTSSNKNTYSFKPGTRFIGNSFTYNNRLLTSIEIPEGVIFVGDGAFANCSQLTTVTLPSSIIKIGNHAFFNIASISLVCKATIPPLLGGDMFSSILSLNKLTIYVPKESVDSYKSHAGWSDYADRIFEISPYI